MTTRVTKAARNVLSCAALGLSLTAHAHHAMESATPSNAFEGFVSGLAHPIIGLDHLLFVLAVGAACYFFRRGVGSVVTFLAATLGGTVIHLYEATLAFPDAWTAASLVAFGALFVAGRTVLKSNAALGLFALSGIVHGYAYGEAIVGAAPTPLFAYLVGFTVVQLALLLAGFILARYADRATPTLRTASALGSMLSLVGIALLVRALV